MVKVASSFTSSPDKEASAEVEKDSHSSSLKLAF